MKSTVNATVDAVAQMNITGNVIPQAWYKTVIKSTGKPYLNAIVILADIVYWYKPVEKRDEGSGQTVALKKKFKSDMLQRSYAQISEQFGITKRDATNAVVHLEKLGVIKRHFRKIEYGGVTLNNVLFIELIPEVLEKLTFDVVEIGDTYHSNGGEGSLKKETGVSQISETNTEITTEITTENKDIYLGESIKPSKRKTKEFIPPTLEEVKDYVKEKGYTFDPKEFFDYYEVDNWHNSSGKPIKNWKRCCVTWQSNENKNRGYSKQQESKPKLIESSDTREWPF